MSTEALHEAAAQVVRSVVTIPNAVSDEMVRGPRRLASRRVERETPEVVVAYLSGTPTHDRDFLEAADAVLWALETHEHVRFTAVGHLRLDERFDAFADRVDRIPFQPWQDLSRLLARVDVNLAPLEPDNPFTEAKSCLKYLEAGLVGVPTIASPRRDFARVIRHGENGLLADTPEEWREALGLLLDSPERRASIGAAALDDVLGNRTVRACARSQHTALASLLGGGERPLVVNWVVRAPIVSSDRYRTIFRLANALAARGHEVRVYVESPAHAEPSSEREIAALVAAGARAARGRAGRRGPTRSPRPTSRSRRAGRPRSRSPRTAGRCSRRTSSRTTSPTATRRTIRSAPRPSRRTTCRCGTSRTAGSSPDASASARASPPTRSSSDVRRAGRRGETAAELERILTELAFLRLDTRESRPAGLTCARRTIDSTLTDRDINAPRFCTAATEVRRGATKEERMSEDTPSANGDARSIGAASSAQPPG